ncbi:hypothetical protein KsCSTR_05050 [Candidatus Kuenenia stuttgartiensis]|uniref:Uncharacterized protein n=1 Tax=Kuenenia stuttgartiensis TaxID=174633 RepID=Q1Q086_KUEST|nr:hypothetical protein KsCSTR_05050 [Candidatus Kuenenia stuttgartiensis]CAJ72737.1 unknown protein [Candidatus Kuenenia stuttgartiensis]
MTKQRFRCRTTLQWTSQCFEKKVQQNKLNYFYRRCLTFFSLFQLVREIFSTTFVL